MRVLLAASIIGGMVAGQASASENIWYGAFHGEFGQVQDTDLDINGASVGTLEYDVEYAAGGALGFIPAATGGFFDNTRYELELTYREGDFSELSNRTIAPGGFGGSVETYTGMANAYYDFNNGSSWTPYVGAGLGYAQHDFDSITIRAADSDGVLAYQAMLGVAHTVKPYDYVRIGVGYRYFGTQSPEFSSAAGSRVELDYDSHNLEGFVRIAF